MFLSALGSRDFRWAFVGRALMVPGHFSVVGYQSYILDDHVALPEGLSAADAMAVLTRRRRTADHGPFVASAVVTALGGCTPLFRFGGALSPGSPRTAGVGGRLRVSGRSLRRCDGPAWSRDAPGHQVRLRLPPRKRGCPGRPTAVTICA
ncbi:hypothetical protein ABT187_23025 [Streptomyces sp. NPDC001817]|uniref:hypothetical protein n=1 Tax=Streptomyces sp. NPDC001817 TaxID=3154398 RepID=UPI00332DE40E